MDHFDHAYFLERLSAYADGELEPSVRTRVEEHLRACAECRARLKEIERLGEFVARESGLAESDYWEKAAQRIEHAVEEIHPKTVDMRPARVTHRASPWWWRAPAIAASVLFLGYVTLHESDILKDEVLTPSPSAVPQPAPQLEAIGTDTSIREVALDSLPLKSPKTPPPVTTPELKQDVIDKYVSEPVRLPEVTAKEEGVELSAAQDQLAGTELNKSIVVAPTVDSSARGAAPAAPSKSEKRAEVTASAEVPKQAPDEEESDVVISLAEEQNYRQKDRDREPFVLRDTLTITPQTLAAPASSEAALSTLQRDELAYWRGQRDSLEQKAALLAQQDTSVVGKALKYAVAPIKEGTRSALSSEDSSKRVKEQTEAELLEAWFQICRLTPDSTEVNQGVDFIEQVAVNQDSENRQAAQGYLKQLGRD